MTSSVFLLVCPSPLVTALSLPKLSIKLDFRDIYNDYIFCSTVLYAYYKYIVP